MKLGQNITKIIFYEENIHVLTLCPNAVDFEFIKQPSHEMQGVLLKKPLNSLKINEKEVNLDI